MQVQGLISKLHIDQDAAASWVLFDEGSTSIDDPLDAQQSLKWVPFELLHALTLLGCRQADCTLQSISMHEYRIALLLMSEYGNGTGKSSAHSVPSCATENQL